MHCPEQYRLYYAERLRPKRVDAALIFGQLVHEAIAQFFRTGVLPAESFANAWNALRNEPLNSNEPASAFTDGLFFLSRLTSLRRSRR